MRGSLGEEKYISDGVYGWVLCGKDAGGEAREVSLHLEEDGRLLAETSPLDYRRCRDGNAREFVLSIISSVIEEIQGQLPKYVPLDKLLLFWEVS